MTHFCCTIFCEKNFVPLLYFCRARPFLRLRDTMDYTNQKLLSYLRKGKKKGNESARAFSFLFFGDVLCKEKKLFLERKKKQHFVVPAALFSAADADKRIPPSVFASSTYRVTKYRSPTGAYYF